jgi:hypothetical protein
MYNGKKGKHATLGISRPAEYRDQKRRPATVLVQLCVCIVLHPVVVFSARLVVAGHDGPDHPVVLTVVAMGRPALGMELTGNLQNHQRVSA